MGLFGGGQEQPSGGLNLGVPQQNGYAQSQSPFGQSQGWTGNSAAGAFMQGAGVNQQSIGSSLVIKCLCLFKC